MTARMRCAALLVLLAACGSDNNGVTGPITAHVTHYDYTLDLDSLAAHSKVSLVADVAGDCMALPFRAASVSAVAFDGANANGTVDNAQLTICGHSVAVGDTFTLDADVTIAVATLGKSQVGFSTSKDSEGNDFTYMVSWVNGCDQFGPCDNRPDQFATYTFDVTHAAAVTVRCSGDVTDLSATETKCDFTDAGGPTYSTFGLAAYPAWTQTDKGTWSGVHVTVYDRASTGIAAAIDPTYHTGFLAWMQSEFGPYPFGTELRVLTAPTYWDGFEHPGNIVLDDGLAKETGGYTYPVQHVLDHEMTHMWAGNQTTLAATYDFAWKESMAEYLSYVYEDMNSATVSAATTQLWKTDAHSAVYWPVPLDKPTLLAYYGDVYGPGPMVFFHQLEVMTSRDAVLRAIKSVLGTPHSLSVDDLVAALSRETGLDLTEYVNGWIKGSGQPNWPTVKTTFTAAPTTSTLAVTITNPTTANRGCQFHVALGDGGTNSVKVLVDTFANGPTQTIMVPTPTFTVSQIVLDPDHECLVFPAAGSAKLAPSKHGWLSQRARAN